MKETVIIVGFSGTGKSVLFKELGLDKVADTDIDQFFLIPKDGKLEDNPEFPNNYIEHIKSLIGKVDIILIPAHQIVIKALNDNKMQYLLVYPTRNCKSIYLKNFKDRGDTDDFINIMDKNWDNFLAPLEKEEGCFIKFPLMRNTYIKDIPMIGR